jgi:hypothetical protein
MPTNTGAPRAVPAGQKAVVISRAVAQSVAGLIETDQRHQYHGQGLRRNQWAADRLGNPVTIQAHGSVRIGEQRHASGSEIRDARQVHTATAASGQRAQRAGADFGAPRHV